MPATACPAGNPVPDYERGLDDAASAGSLAGVTIGVPDRYYFDGVDHEVAELLAASRVVLEKRGAKIIDVPIGDHGAVNDFSNAILWPEAAGLHLEWLRERPQDYAPQTRARLLVGLGVPATLYVEAVRGRARLLEELLRETFSKCDVLHIPVLKRSVPTAAETDVGARPRWRKCLVRLSPIPAHSMSLGCPAYRCRSALPAIDCRRRCSSSRGRSAKICCFVLAPPTRPHRAVTPSDRRFSRYGLSN